jgi:predicted transposase/invertase (TIGR01784 family)
MEKTEHDRLNELIEVIYYEMPKTADAVVEGRQEGRLEGSMASREEIARKALAEGASIEFVQKITGLSDEEIKKLGG